MGARLAIAGLALALAASMSGCGETSTSAEADEELQGAESFDTFDLYYAGEAVKGERLDFSGLTSDSGEGVNRAWSFVYGTCEAKGDEGCAPPFEIQNWSICQRFAALYPGSTPRTKTISGAETTPAGGGLDVYTGRTTVVIYGRNPVSIVSMLREVGEDEPAESLPPPVPGALEGKLPCQAERLQRFGG